VPFCIWNLPLNNASIIKQAANVLQPRLTCGARDARRLSKQELKFSMWAVLALELGLVSLKSAGCASHTRLLATLRLEPACFTGVALRELLVVEKQRRCQLSSRAPRFELDAEALANFRLVLALRASKAGRTEEPCLEGVD
jgi:hypothetical protein